ncbi:Aste57867_18881 [Aphanomyces stellatus]|uniref:Aste57867_18881 protein n=1 Tax=Aphanomyces stellatus TaxID=120398 RepID=A0A485LBG5_9STRA|nr:hypothetical protein As57867_018817 [Aphanomyces stellatus]VFT95615.1 Aste57867_18881 [Aphanomyces stellatus]
MKGVVFLTAAVVAVLGAVRDPCETQYCTLDDGTTCDRSLMTCPTCINSKKKCKTTDILGTCTFVGFGDYTSCTAPWKNPDNPSTPSPTNSSDPTDSPTTTATPTTTKATKTPAPTTTDAPTTTAPVTTSKPTLNNTTKPTTKPLTTSASSTTTTLTPSETPSPTMDSNTSQQNKKDDSSGGMGIGAWIGIAVGAAAFIAIVAFLVYRMKHRDDDDEEEDEIVSYNKQPRTEPAQYNPYGNKPPAPSTEAAPAMAAAANLRAKLNQSEQSSDSYGAQRSQQVSHQGSMNEGGRVKSVHADVWGNVPTSFREGGVGESSFNGSFMSEDDLRRTGNSTGHSSGNRSDSKVRDNETRLSVEF